MKRMTAMLLVLSVCLLSACGTAGAADVDTTVANVEDTMELNTSAGVVATEDLSEYIGGEVLVGYTDGTFEVLTYEDEDALSAGLETLAANESVSLVQPNYSYSNSVYWSIFFHIYNSIHHSSG